MTPLIEPRILRGFRDYPPELMIPRERCQEQARQVFRAYGFAPIDTPALELSEVLLAKVEEGAEIGRQLFRFRDNGDRDVTLRFDLTVPLARFVSQHATTLGWPFRRYHIGTVWRGETPKAGRFREFTQCDFDTVGTTAAAADIEIALVIHDLMLALGFERFAVRVNHRAILSGLLGELGLGERAAPILRTLDKLDKIGRAAVIAEMVTEAGLSADQAGAVIDLAEIGADGDDVPARLRERYPANADVMRGVGVLEEMRRVWAEAGLPPERLRIDLSICRGLDYYTGTVYETFLDDLPGIGSVCSGGRYDNLTGRYTKQALPGVGASLGLDRLLAAMEELKLLPPAKTAAPLLVVQFSAVHLGDYHRVARRLRAKGIGAEVYPDGGKKIGAQLQYAERRGFRAALIAGEAEFAAGVWKLKDLTARTEQSVGEEDLAAAVRVVLGRV